MLIFIPAASHFVAKHPSVSWSLLLHKANRSTKSSNRILSLPNLTPFTILSIKKRMNRGQLSPIRPMLIIHPSLLYVFPSKRGHISNPKIQRAAFLRGKSLCWKTIYYLKCLEFCSGKDHFYMEDHMVSVMSFPIMLLMLISLLQFYIIEWRDH